MLPNETRGDAARTNMMTRPKQPARPFHAKCADKTKRSLVYCAVPFPLSCTRLTGLFLGRSTGRVLAAIPPPLSIGEIVLDHDRARRATGAVSISRCLIELPNYVSCSSSSNSIAHPCLDTSSRTLTQSGCNDFLNTLRGSTGQVCRAISSPPRLMPNSLDSNSRSLNRAVSVTSSVDANLFPLAACLLRSIEVNPAKFARALFPLGLLRKTPRVRQPYLSYLAAPKRDAPKLSSCLLQMHLCRFRL